MNLRTLAVLVAVGFAPGLALGQATPHVHGSPSQAAIGPADEAYREAHRTMMAGMEVPTTGDPDRDFARMMIPHHQGAVDMARIQLRYGKDPELRALAEQIIKDQEREIAFMTQWLAKAGR
jgi:uncharacterized protein (DUF305 family)